MERPRLGSPSRTPSYLAGSPGPLNGRITTVPGTNLTRDEAAQRARLLDMAGYDVTLNLTTGDKTFRTTSVVRFAARTPGAATFVDLIADAVHEVVLNGRSLPVQEV